MHRFRPNLQRAGTTAVPYSHRSPADFFYNFAG
jgi:hypothetical protein